MKARTISVKYIDRFKKKLHFNIILSSANNVEDIVIIVTRRCLCRTVTISILFVASCRVVLRQLPVACEKDVGMWNCTRGH